MDNAKRFTGPYWEFKEPDGSITSYSSPDHIRDAILAKKIAPKATWRKVDPVRLPGESSDQGWQSLVTYVPCEWCDQIINDMDVPRWEAAARRGACPECGCFYEHEREREWKRLSKIPETTRGARRKKLLMLLTGLITIPALGYILLGMWVAFVDPPNAPYYGLMLFLLISQSIVDIPIVGLLLGFSFYGFVVLSPLVLLLLAVLSTIYIIRYGPNQYARQLLARSVNLYELPNYQNVILDEKLVLVDSFKNIQALSTENQVLLLTDKAWKRSSEREALRRFKAEVLPVILSLAESRAVTLCYSNTGGIISS